MSSHHNQIKKGSSHKWALLKEVRANLRGTVSGGRPQPLHLRYKHARNYNLNMPQAKVNAFLCHQPSYTLALNIPNQIY